MPRTLSRFVEISLELYAHEGTFRIEAPAGEDFEALARQFEEKGCAVDRDPIDRALNVTPRAS